MNSLGYVPIPYVFVGTDNFSGWSNSNGYVAVVDSTLNKLDIKLSYQGIINLCEYPDTLRVKTPDYISTVQDSIFARFHDNPCNSLNIYYHTLDQFHGLDSISPFSGNTSGVRIIANMPLTMNNLGEFDPSYNAIRIRGDIGKFSLVARHELSHAFIWDKLNGAFFHNSDTSKRAMDEAFAVYLPCSAINSSLYINSPYPPNNVNDITNYTVSDVLANFPLEYPGVVPSEDFYPQYFCRYPIASAWWEIRSHLGNTDFDQDLIDALTNDVSPTDSLRYKPRYFYNALMRNSTPSNQLVIDKAYSDRGLHFTPQAISAGVSNPPDERDKNMFRIGDPVHVKVTNCPQNTPLTVYVVEDQDYTDGMNISALNNVVCQISGPGVHSDNEGVWYSSTPVMTTSAEGDYDILVDIGNNGVLHFAYNGANVRDGFDGLDGLGFTVFDDRIDIAISLDQSGSMNNNAQHIQKTAMQFLSCLNQGDRVNVY